MFNLMGAQVLLDYRCENTRPSIIAYMMGSYSRINPLWNVVTLFIEDHAKEIPATVRNPVSEIRDHL